MEFLFTLVAFLLLIGVVVTVHEAGHFFAAILCNIKVVEFSIGFGPKIFQKKWGKDGTLFTLRAIPAGGFVKPLDQSAVGKEVWDNLSETEKNRSFVSSAKWKKAFMVAGGPFSNFLLAFVIFTSAFLMVGDKGLPAIIGEVVEGGVLYQSGLRSGDRIKEMNGRVVNFSSDAHAVFVDQAISNGYVKVLTEDGRTLLVDFSKLDLLNLKDDLGHLIGGYFQGPLMELKIEYVAPGKIGERSGLMVGDVVKSVNGIETRDLNKILRIIRNNPEIKVPFIINRNGKTLNFEITPEAEKISGEVVGKVGVKFVQPDENVFKTLNYGFVDSSAEAIRRIYSGTMITLISLKKIVTGEISTKALSGPLTIADYSGKSAQRGLFAYLMMMAAISIAVGVFNLLPVPLLDGGHLFQYFVEAIRRRDFTVGQIQFAQYVGVGAISGLFVVAIINDIIKYFG